MLQKTVAISTILSLLVAVTALIYQVYSENKEVPETPYVLQEGPPIVGETPEPNVETSTIGNDDWISTFNPENPDHAEARDYILREAAFDIANLTQPKNLGQFTYKFFIDHIHLGKLLNSGSFNNFDVERAFRSNLCNKHNRLEQSMYLLGGLNEFHSCWPAGGTVGSSPEFWIYWARNKLRLSETGDIDFNFELKSIKRLQEYQYTLFERLREHFSSPENVQSSYNELRPIILKQCTELKDEYKRTWISLLSRSDELLSLVSEVCSTNSCGAEIIDFSLAESSRDTGWMTGNSPLKQYIDYANYSLDEIRILEFGVRRFSEGGVNLVSIYKKILRDMRSTFETCFPVEEQKF